jgi:DNA-binding transcriptional LysR family regulator
MFIIPANALRTEGMQKQVLYQDSYVCIAAKDNDALNAGMSSDDFLALPHIGYSAMPRVIFNHEMMLWNDLDKHTNLRLTMGNYLIFARIVSSSKAVAILPKRLAESLTGEWNLKWIDIPLPTPELEIAAMWRPDQGKDIALTWLRETLVDIAKG